jgi:alpha-tubulin suppressor-like RCC1 family protein
MAAIPYVDLGSNAGIPFLAKRIYSRENHNCAIYDEPGNPNKLKCWGYNGYGQLGTGDTTSRGGNATSSAMGNDLPKVPFTNGTWPIDLALGEHHTCAILNTNGVKCWGRADLGQLGNESPTTISTRSAIINLSEISFGILNGSALSVKILSANAHNNCAVLSNDSIKCFGYNLYGELGQGRTTREIGDAAGEMGGPLPTTLLSTKFVANGHDATCALLSNNAVKCWGRNNAGQLGRGNGNGPIGQTTAQMENLADLDLDI